MVITSNREAIQTQAEPGYDQRKELKAFDDSKAGVKGLVDAGVTKIPHIFIHEKSMLQETDMSVISQFSVPIIDFEGINKGAAQRGKIINNVRDACEKWGFFQVVNHGIPMSIMDEMIDGVRKFHEQDTEVKKKFYSRDVTRKFIYNSNFDLYQSSAAKWRDTIACIMAPYLPDPDELPIVCRDILIEYSKYTMRLGLTLLELLSEALGLNPDHLKDMDCAEGLFIVGHYYPACPEPELTLGTDNHADMGGLQILHNNQWVDVTPLPGALVVNIADLLQLITNDKFKSINHRVLAKNISDFNLQNPEPGETLQFQISDFNLQNPVRLCKFQISISRSMFRRKPRTPKTQPMKFRSGSLKIRKKTIFLLLLRRWTGPRTRALTRTVHRDMGRSGPDYSGGSPDSSMMVTD
ncbi:hypothetical protein LOK49_LG08G00850 [Camellia lanceoleosa]|uniref:Uncharacterized protein n=1 Tax=Camellia lanceoleosa TaxID=1840588 RepID=A0ACC0GQJ6_9ERIC|nr:hypothetical protein LOK49_LG08G00850 [Camellia lanceoleosa]